MFEKKVREVVEELKNTKEFNVLKKAKNNLDRNSQLKRRVEQFSHDHAEICRRPDGGGKLQQEELERKFDEMMRVPEIATYVKAGQKFDDMVTHLHQLIDELIDQALEESSIQ